mgnify:CR=1 FL=1
MGDRDQASEVPEGQKSREVPEGFRKNRNELLRKIPKIDRLMEMESVKAQCELYGYQIVLEAARKAQEQLREVLPPEESNDFCHRLVLHGRAVCTARTAKCELCPLCEWCDHFLSQGKSSEGNK